MESFCKLTVVKPSLVLFHFDDDKEKVDDDLMRSFPRSFSSNQFRFQADGFSKWLCMDNRVDNGQADYAIQGSEPRLDDAAAVWSPPRNTTTCNLDDGFDLSADVGEKGIFNLDDMRYSSSKGHCTFSSHMVAFSFLKGNGVCKKNIRNCQIDSAEQSSVISSMKQSIDHLALNEGSGNDPRSKASLLKGQENERIRLEEFRRKSTCWYAPFWVSV
ncbi:hypothetical protein L6452_10226 [Arctium lappa]|uniref:Uncharacterized protein n=1 Tax=Arctium lappa TaxID=4217 RepID=A0ACB9DLV8_ARCLA|nr:hypothetical protein L6452_10226 [Arctium lappa]